MTAGTWAESVKESADSLPMTFNAYFSYINRLQIQLMDLYKEKVEKSKDGPEQWQQAITILRQMILEKLAIPDDIRLIDPENRPTESSPKLLSAEISKIKTIKDLHQAISGLSETLDNELAAFDLPTDLSAMLPSMADKALEAARKTMERDIKTIMSAQPDRPLS